MTRIELTDDIKTMVVKMSDGNPGAVCALTSLLSKKCVEIDQDSMSGPVLGPFLTLDMLEIYGTGIYILWNDKCHRDIRRFVMLLRATQLGLLSQDKVREMAADQMRQINLTGDEWAELDANVVDRLPGFMSVETWATRQDYTPTGGETIHDAISNAIDLAGQIEDTAQFEFNGVKVLVTATSDKDLIYRDCLLAMEGCLEKQVGPDPVIVHDETKLAHFAKIRAENARRKEQQEEEVAAASRKKKDIVDTVLANAAPIELSDADAWHEAVVKNTDPYGAASIQYAERWARLMQVAIADGKQLADVTEVLSHDADTDGITGFMYGCAVSVLSHCWVHGEELRQWYNAKYNITR